MLCYTSGGQSWVDPPPPNKSPGWSIFFSNYLLMGELLHLGWIVNNRINYQPQLVFTPDFWTINSIELLHFDAGAPGRRCLLHSPATVAARLGAVRSNLGNWKLISTTEHNSVRAELEFVDLAEMESNYARTFFHGFSSDLDSWVGEWDGKSLLKTHIEQSV